MSPAAGVEQLSDGRPAPALADGAPYRFDHPVRVGEHAGLIAWIVWCHPDGTHMPADQIVVAATKTKPARTRPGAWWAVVTWHQRFPHPPNRHRLDELHTWTQP